MVDLTQAVMWHRQVAALAAAADRAGVCGDALPDVRARLLAQQVRFADAAARSGRPAPALVPTPTEISAAAPALGDLSPAAAAEAMRTASSTLDAVDAVLAEHLAGPAGPAPGIPAPGLPAPVTSTSVMPAPIAAAPVAALPSMPPTEARAMPATVRNAFVYGGFASTVLIIQLVLLATVDDERSLPLLAPFCLGVLPAFAWAAGWFTIGALFRSPAGGPRLKRSPRLGIAIAFAPNFLLCAGLGVLFLIHRN